MSMGGHSLHKKDYAMLAALTAAGATGAGAAGIGPMAGLMGMAPAADALATAPAVGQGLTGAADLAAGGAATPGIGSTIAQTGLFGHAFSGPDMMGMLGRFGKGASMMQKMGQLGGGQQQAAPAPVSMGPRTPPPSQPFQLYPQMATPTGFNPDPDEQEKLRKLLERLQQQQGI